MKAGQFSAYININTGAINLVKSPNEFEYQDNSNYSTLIEHKAKKDVLDRCIEYFEENYVPEERRVII